MISFFGATGWLPGQGSVETDASAGASRQAVQIDGLPLSAERRSEIQGALNAGDLTRAESLLVEEHRRTPDSASILNTLAAVSFRNGHYRNAAIAYKRAEKLAPLDDSARFSLAMAYVIFGRGDWARPELERLHADNPENPLYLYWLARLDYDKQVFPAAAEKLQRVIEMDPGFLRAHDRLGLCYEAMGKFEEASNYFAKAITLNREQDAPSPWPPLNFGAMLFKLGKVEEAEPFLQEAVRHGPNLSQARYQLGVLLERQDKLEEAMDHLQRAATLDPDDSKPHYALGRIYRRLGQDQKSKEALQKFEELKEKEQEAPDSRVPPGAR